MSDYANKKYGISECLLTFLCTGVVYLLYISKFFENNSATVSAVINMLETVGVVPERAKLMTYLLLPICLIILLALGFAVYKVIFRILKIKINDVKLLIAVQTGYAASFLAGYLLVGIAPYVVAVLVGNILEMAFLLMMCSEEIRPKYIPVVLLRSTLIIINLVISLASSAIGGSLQ